MAIATSGTARAVQWLGAYDYPFVDPLVATVVQTPHANSIELPELVRFENVDIYTVRGRSSGRFHRFTSSSASAWNSAWWSSRVRHPWSS
ncbi:MAG: hypothetical protein R3D28_08245 [Geminicoccaceae bacterium]